MARREGVTEVVFRAGGWCSGRGVVAAAARTEAAALRRRLREDMGLWLHGHDCSGWGPRILGGDGGKLLRIMGEIKLRGL